MAASSLHSTKNEDLINFNVTDLITFTEEFFCTV